MPPVVTSRWLRFPGMGTALAITGLCWIVSVWGCASESSEEPVRDGTGPSRSVDEERDSGDRVQPKTKVDRKPAEDPGSNQDTRLIAGATLETWRQRIKELDPKAPQSPEVISGLIALMSDDDIVWFTRRQAALTLGRIGKPAESAIPVLVGLLKETNGEVPPRIWAMKALALFGPVAAPATDALTKILREQSLPAEHRMGTIDALTRIGATEPRALAAVIETLTLRPTGRSPARVAEAAAMRELAAEGLAYVGPAAAAAVPALIRATSDESESVRRKAAAAIGAVGPQADVAIPALADLIVLDESEAVRDVAATALARIGEASTPILIRLLQADEAEIRSRAAAALGRMVRATVESRRALAATLDDVDATVRITAVESLWNSTRDANVVIPPLLAALTESDRQVRIRAYRLLIAMGPRATPAVEPLRRMLTDERPHVRQAVAKALSALERAGVTRDPKEENQDRSSCDFP